jgi:diguanylate cyclase (GGDEF)-like protein
VDFQALTGSVAFAVTQTAVALFMAGLYVAARRDACTRYWAIASALIAIGVVAPFPFITTPLRLPAVVLGTSAIVAGLVVMWWGMRVFFGRRPKAVGWWLMGGHAVFVALLFAFSPETHFRVISFAIAVGVAVTLIVLEVWRGSGGPLTVARRLVVFAYIVTLAPIIARAAILLGTGVRMTPLTDNTFNVIMLYLLPMAGGLLSSVGTLLMYFERTIDEKDYLASHDELTRLYNRRAFTEQGMLALAGSARQNRPVSMLLIDIDHFKSVNDTLGHEAGDQALYAIAATLAAGCRRSDVIGRHGGEEFCIVCPDTAADDAMLLSERLLREVEAIVPPPGLARGFSVSIGIATMAHGAAWDSLLQQADRALYIAKEAGRNRVVAA